jgi:AraC-like DNA-binding protein
MEGFQNDRIKKVIKQVIPIHYFLITIVACLVGASAYIALRMDSIIWYVAIFSLLHISWAIFIYSSNYVTEEYFVPFYYIFMTIYLFPGILFLWEIQVYSAMLPYILLPLIIMFYNFTAKQTIYACISSGLFIVAILVTSAKFDFIQVDLNRKLVPVMNIIIIAVAMIYIVVFNYFYREILREENDNVYSKQTKEEENERLKELYNNLIDFFEKKQPYRQPHYRLNMLAADLITNTKYLSEAINTHYGESFESLLNKYRLDYAKKMLDEQLADKYTIEYIYTMSGYSSRSAFYKNFRKTFRMTPLEYQQMQKMISN